ncbi:MAG: hypothetical protein HQK92_07630 [Nitrospirae bacterium]|nr:hypothetical protein [Nitrospirota bacterium]
MVAHYLDYFRYEPVSDKSLTKVKGDDQALIIQVKEWLQEISPDINIHVESYEDSYKINYSYSRGKGTPPTDLFRAVNIGFGVSYVLPIIVAALHVKKGGLVLIENPESHIHPSGQAKLM